MCQKHLLVPSPNPKSAGMKRTNNYSCHSPSVNSSSGDWCSGALVLKGTHVLSSVLREGNANSDSERRWLISSFSPEERLRWETRVGGQECREASCPLLRAGWISAPKRAWVGSKTLNLPGCRDPFTTLALGQRRNRLKRTHLPCIQYSEEMPEGHSSLQAPLGLH